MEPLLHLVERRSVDTSWVHIKKFPPKCIPLCKKKPPSREATVPYPSDFIT